MNHQPPTPQPPQEKPEPERPFSPPPPQQPQQTPIRKNLSEGEPIPYEKFQPQEKTTSPHTHEKTEFRKEAKELFRREDVQTMKKDLMRLREEESDKERERLAKLKTREEVEKERARIARLKKEEEERMFAKSATLERQRAKIQADREKELGLEKIAEAQRPTPPTPTGGMPQEITPQKELPEQKKEEKQKKSSYRLPFPLPKRPSVFEKVFSRTVFIVILIALWGTFITFWYWFLVVREEEKPVVEPPVQEEQIPSPPEEEPEKEMPTEPELPALPQPLIPVDADTIIEFANAQELPQLLEEAVRQYGGGDRFTRILLYDQTRNEYVSLPAFFQYFGITATPPVVAGLSPEFTLFVYSSQIANRLGFAAQITGDKNAFEDAMRGWESTIEQDTQELFGILEKREPSKDSSFRQATRQEIPFRYISFPSINFGIVWSIVPSADKSREYFVFTSSGESMMKMIDRILEAPPLLETQPGLEPELETPEQNTGVY